MRKTDSSRGGSLFSGAIQQGKECSSSGAGKITPALRAPHSSAHLLYAPSAKQDMVLDTPCPIGAGLMPTTPFSEVSTQQPPRLGTAFSWLLGKGWRWALGVTFWCGLDRNGGKDGTRCWVAGDGRSCPSSFSCKTTKAEVRDIPFAGPLFWGTVAAPADGGRGCTSWCNLVWVGC